MNLKIKIFHRVRLPQTFSIFHFKFSGFKLFMLQAQFNLLPCLSIFFSCFFSVLIKLSKSNWERLYSWFTWPFCWHFSYNLSLRLKYFSFSLSLPFASFKFYLFFFFIFFSYFFKVIDSEIEKKEHYIRHSVKCPHKTIN